MHKTPDILKALYARLEDRKGASPTHSYTARLYQGGLDRILRKIGEESGEVLIAAKNQDRPSLVHEFADLWFHGMVLLSFLNIPYEEVLEELKRRMEKKP
ncbi:MAG: phosphoribosyl-ATP diphosphatase [Gammaproteobacteria bacterium]|nr:phosphoribosyl-ATP diphosphatase [Gammaproteobacteria bacterium]